MDGDMLTEDIDSALRAFTKDAKAVHHLNVVSYELAPTSLRAFWKQRLRWAQGWAQASMKHLIHTVNKHQESPLFYRFCPVICSYACRSGPVSSFSAHPSLPKWHTVPFFCGFPFGPTICKYPQLIAI